MDGKFNFNNWLNKNLALALLVLFGGGVGVDYLLPNQIGKEEIKQIVKVAVSEALEERNNRHDEGVIAFIKRIDKEHEECVLKYANNENPVVELLGSIRCDNEKHSEIILRDLE